MVNSNKEFVILQNIVILQKTSLLIKKWAKFFIMVET